MFKKIVNFFLIILILIYIVFEEIVWEKTAKPIIKLILKLHIFDNIILKIQRLNSYLVLFIFLVLFAFVELLGIYAAIVFLKGEIVLAVFVYLLKVPLAVLILWFFDITKDKLLDFRWFKSLYTGLIFIKHKITRSKIYKLVQNKIDSIKEYIESKFTSSQGLIKNRIIELYQNLKAKLRL